MYAPYLLQRMSFRYAEQYKGLGMHELVNFDYMGSAEFEFGAVGACLSRCETSRRQGELWSLVALTCVPRRKSDAHRTAFAQGNILYALMRSATLETYGGPAGISEGIQRVFDGQRRLKESMHETGPFCGWLDIQNDIFIAPNETFLALVHSMLSRPMSFSHEVDRTISMGDQVDLAVIINGRTYKSVYGMRVRSGPVTGLMEDQIVIRHDMKSFRMPYVYLLSHPIQVLNPTEAIQ